MNIKIVSLGATLALISLTAHADLVIDGVKSNPVSVIATPAIDVKHNNDFSYGSSKISSQEMNLGFITESGNRPKKIATAGWAHNVPLSLALRQIIPLDFEIKSNGVGLEKSVSWSSGHSWVYVLNEFAPNSFVAHIDWNRKVVSLAPCNKSVCTPNTSFHTEVHSYTSQEKNTSFSINQDKVFTPAPHVIVKANQQSPLNKIWALDPKLSLRENVIKWGKEAGWRVVWDAADYPIIAPANFYGVFDSPTGPLAKLISAYDNSDQPLIASLTTMDKVVYVKNKFFDRTQVPLTTPGTMSPVLYDQSKNASH